MKKTLAVLISVLLCLSVLQTGFTVFADDSWETEWKNMGYEISGLYAYKYDPEYHGVWVRSLNTDAFPGGVLTIPSQLAGYKVIGIGDNGFCVNCSTLTGVVIPGTVFHIGAFAFSECENLKTVTIPNSVTSISHWAFSQCTSLKTISLPDSITELDAWAFCECIGLSDIYYAGSMAQWQKIDFYDEYYGSAGLDTQATIHFKTGDELIKTENGIRYLVSAASVEVLSADSALKGAVTLPEHYRNKPVTRIADHAFVDCENITSLYLPSEITEIGRSAFAGCLALQEITLPTALSVIGEYAFSSCEALKKVSASQCAVSKFSEIFAGANNIETVIVQPGVTEIPEKAFQNRVKLKTIVLPESVASIGNDAFKGCTGLTAATIGTSVLDSFWRFRDCENLTDITVAEGVKTIPSQAFIGHETITNITLPDSLVSIGDYAFDGCKKTQTITLPKNVAHLGEGAFAYCSELRSIRVAPENEYFESENGILYNKGKTVLVAYPAGSTAQRFSVPESVTEIGSLAFYNAANLTAVTVNKNVTTIGISAFSRCSSLTSVSLPDGLLYIENGAFSECNSLTAVELPEGLKSLGDWAFRSCTSLSEIDLPTGLTGFGFYVFEDCPRLRFSAVPAGAKTVFPVFQGNTELRSIKIPEGVTAIADEAFSGCTGLTSVEIPNSVNYIGKRAFEGCTALTSIKLPENLKTINSYAFNGCTNLKTIQLPANAQIGSSAFADTAWFNAQPDGVIYIGKTAYKYKGEMPAGTKLTIQTGTNAIAANAFRGCEGLTSIVIPDSVKRIGEYAFNGCTSLQSVSVPDSVTMIGSDIFGGTPWYNSQPAGKVKIGNVVVYKTPDYDELQAINPNIVIPDGTTQIGGWSLRMAETVSIPDSVNSISSWAFMGSPWMDTQKPINGMIYAGKVAYDWRGDDRSYPEQKEWLTDVVLRDGTVGISQSTFIRITGSCNPHTITIPASVTHIDDWAFSYTRLLTDVYYLGTQEQWEQIEIGDDNTPLFAATLHCQEATEDTNVVKTIGDKAFTKQNKTAKELLAAAHAEKILDLNGDPLAENALVGSGMQLVKADGSVKTIVIKGDNDGDGIISASDARLALRQAVGLENFNDWQTAATLVGGSETITAAEARLILRAAVGLEDADAWFSGLI